MIAATFSGCDAQVYPPISGTVKVIKKLSNGYVVSTGHQVVYGACTQQVACNVGDTLSYNGFIVNGVVNAQRIQRVLLSWFLKSLFIFITFMKILINKLNKLIAIFHIIYLFI